MSTDTKTALMDSAENAAHMRGFDGFSYADLAQDVGIRKASIHYHFPTKAALSVALIQRYYTDIEHACQKIDTNWDTGAERLNALIDHYRAALNGGKSLCLCVSFSTARDSLSNDVIAEICRFRAMLINWLTAVFAKGKQDGTIANAQDPRLEASATLPLLEGAQLAARAEEDTALFDGATELLAQRFQMPD